ncbi:hypothetical protein OAK16_04525 [Verrucomicrobia bacterium]|nr:hypothetical protein [Verrucomicrobiota bacterium]
MTPVRLLVLLVTLPLLLGGCGEKGVSMVEKLALRGDTVYLKSSSAPFTGKTFILHANGEKKIVINYKNGIRDGVTKGFNENGHKWVETNYKNDKLDGLRIRWHGNGQKESEGNFKNGKSHGLETYWQPNGQKWAEMIWENDKKISESYWNSKGEPVDSREEALEE